MDLLPRIRIGHLQITDHLILGVSMDQINSGKKTLTHSIIEPVVMHNWQQVTDALTNEELDGAFLLAPAAMDLFKSGVPIKLILFTHRSGSMLVKNKSAHINELSDLKGKIILIPYQLSVHTLLLHKLLSDIGLRVGTTKDPLADVFLEVMAPAMMPEAIQYDEDGEIGGFIVAEPIGSQVIAEGHGERICLSKDLWPEHPCCVFVMQNKILSKHPDAVQEITNSFVESGIFIEQHPQEAAEIGARFLNQKVELISTILSDPEDRLSTGRLFPNTSELTAIQEYMYNDMKLISAPINITQFVETRFAKSANAK